MDQRLLNVPPARGIDLKCVAIQLTQQKRLCALVMCDLSNESCVTRSKQERISIANQFNTSVATNIFPDIKDNIRWDIVFAIACQQLDDCLRTHAACCRIPEREW